MRPVVVSMTFLLCILALTTCSEEKKRIANNPSDPASVVSGEIRTTTWYATHSPYYVVGEVTVPAGNTLTIEPGVDVLFDDDVRFYVEGTLEAIGTKSDSIRFLKGEAGQWGSIRFIGGTTSYMAFVRISDGYARNQYRGDPEYWDGGGIAVLNTGTALIASNIVLSGNRTNGEGGGIALGTGASAEISSSYIVGNSAINGGGIKLGRGSLDLTNCVIARNTTTQWGGGVLASGSQGTSICNVIHCTIAQNQSNLRGEGVHSKYLATINVENSIVWGSTSTNEIGLEHSGVVNIRYSNIEGSWPGEGNINLYPHFIDPANGDYRLISGSPGINSGDPTTPTDADGSRADMGALPKE
jgi:hypothetical protein